MHCAYTKTPHLRRYGCKRPSIGARWNGKKSVWLCILEDTNIHRAPLWTAFITDNVQSPGWLRRMDSKSLYLRHLRRTVFFPPEFTLPQGRKPEYILRFASKSGKCGQCYLPLRIYTTWSEGKSSLTGPTYRHRRFYRGCRGARNWCVSHNPPALKVRANARVTTTINPALLTIMTFRTFWFAYYEFLRLLRLDVCMILTAFYHPYCSDIIGIIL